MAQTAQEIMTRTGLSPGGQHDDAVRWIAVRHAPDHIHIVATLARQDATKPRIWNDLYRVREACRTIEDRYGLQSTAPGDRTATRRPTRVLSGAQDAYGLACSRRLSCRRRTSTRRLDRRRHRADNRSGLL